jgi:hypothetical protein
MAPWLAERFGYRETIVAVLEDVISEGPSVIWF